MTLKKEFELFFEFLKTNSPKIGMINNEQRFTFCYGISCSNCALKNNNKHACEDLPNEPSGGMPTINVKVLTKIKDKHPEYFV